MDYIIIKNMLTVVDYGAGNLKSVVNALKVIGSTPEVTSDPDKIFKADKILLPGVGAFGECMKKLNQSGISEAIVKAAAKGTPLLGICLGLQMLFDYSTEFGNNAGLGLVGGGVELLKTDGLKLPHIAWTSIDVNPDSRLLKGIDSGEFFYFVHSYRAKAENRADIAAEAEYGERFTAAVEKGNIMATQFHPEKSGKAGLKVLANFVNL